MARLTGLEPATPGVTGRYSNQLSYNRPLHSPGRPGAFGCSMVRALCRQARFVRKYENFASCSWGVWGPASRLQNPRCSPRVRGALIGLVAGVQRVGQRNGIAFLASHITSTRMVHGGCTKTLHKLHRQFFLVADRTSLNGRGVLGRKSRPKLAAQRTGVGRALHYGSRSQQTNTWGRWWVVRGSNSRHLRCKRSALPTELTTRLGPHSARWGRASSL